MDITINHELEAMIRRHVDSGRCSAPADVIREAMDLFEERERRREELRRAIAEGQAAVDRGEVCELDLEEIKRKGRERVANEVAGGSCGTFTGPRKPRTI